MLTAADVGGVVSGMDLDALQEQAKQQQAAAVANANANGGGGAAAGAGPPKRLTLSEKLRLAGEEIERLKKQGGGAEIERLQSALGVASKERDAKQQELDALRAKLLSGDAQAERAGKDRIEELEGQLEQSAQAGESTRRMTHMLKSKMAKAEKALAEQSAAEGELKASHSKLLEELDATRARLEAELAEARSEFVRVEEESRGHAGRAEAAAAEAAAAGALHAASEERCVGLGREVDALREELARAGQDAQSGDATAQEARDRVRALEASLAETSERLNATEAARAAAVAEAEAGRQREADLAARVRELEAELGASVRECGEVRVELGAAFGDVDTLRGTVASLEAALEAAMAGRAAAERSAEALSASNVRVEADLARKRTECTQLAGRLQSLVKSGEQYIHDREEWQSRLDAVESKATMQARVFAEERAALVATIDAMRERMTKAGGSDALNKMRVAAARLRKRSVPQVPDLGNQGSDAVGAAAIPGGGKKVGRKEQAAAAEAAAMAAAAVVAARREQAPQEPS